MQRYADAVNLLLRFAVVCDTTGATGSQCKCYLSAVVVWLFAGDASQAWAVYQVGCLPASCCSASDMSRACSFRLSNQSQGRPIRFCAGCTGRGCLFAE